jgi:hypothetical protein
MVSLNQKVQVSEGVWQIKNNMTVGRYDVVMDTGPGYETKRLEAAENMIDLLKTPLGEPIVKTGADIIVRNMDFPGADDLADRLLPSNPQGMQKAIKNLPKEAQGIVQALQQQLTQAQQVIQQQGLELKYKVGVAQIQANTKEHDTRVRAVTSVHDTETRARTEIEKAHIQAQAGIAETEISTAGHLMDTHLKGTQSGHQAERDAEHALEQAEKAEKSNGAKNG